MLEKKHNLIFIGILLALIFLIVINLCFVKAYEHKNYALIERAIADGYTMFKHIKPGMWWFYDYMFNYVFIYIIVFIQPIIVIYIGLFSFFKLLKSGMFKYIVNVRKKYNKTMLREIFRCYKYALLYPLLFIITIFLCAIFSSFNFGIDGLSDISYIFDTSYGSPIIFIVAICLNLFLSSIFYINIGLLSSLKTKNNFINLVFSFLIITIIGIATLFIGEAIGSSTGINAFGNIANFYSLWLPYDADNIFFVTIFLLGLVLISGILVFRVYKNKELVLNA